MEAPSEARQTALGDEPTAGQRFFQKTNDRDGREFPFRERELQHSPETVE